MPMTMQMAAIATVLESQLRPGLAEFIEREYKQRSGDAPTVLRTKELVDQCLNAMRLKLEECFDKGTAAGEVKSLCLLAIKLELAFQLDKEFPRLIVPA